MIEILYFFNIDGSPWELWGSTGMEEEYFLKWEMGNILDGRVESGKVLPVQYQLRSRFWVCWLETPTMPLWKDKNLDGFLIVNEIGDDVKQIKKELVF
jgi:hypothetical protein